MPDTDTVDTTIVVGDRVRSHDFDRLGPTRSTEGEDACYIEGVVEAITDPKTHEYFKDCPRYAIRVSKRMFAGENRDGPGSNVGELIFPPVNGTPTWLDNITSGVVKY